MELVQVQHRALNGRLREDTLRELTTSLNGVARTLAATIGDEDQS